MKKVKMKKKLLLNKISIALLNNETKRGIRGGVRGEYEDAMEDYAPGSNPCKTDYTPICPQNVASLIIPCYENLM